MHRAITFIMLTTMLALGAVGFAAAQEGWGGDTVIKDNSAVNSQSNGQPVQGKVDAAAVAELDQGILVEAQVGNVARFGGRHQRSGAGAQRARLRIADEPVALFLEVPVRLGAAADVV